MRCTESNGSPVPTRRIRTMLLSCGDALIDFLPVNSVDGRDAFVPAVGGSCLNIAVGMARLGAPAGFVGGISTDLFGRMIADHASASEVDLQYATRSEHQTTLAFVRSVAGDCIDFPPTGLSVAHNTPAGSTANAHPGRMHRCEKNKSLLSYANLCKILQGFAEGDRRSGRDERGCGLLATEHFEAFRCGTLPSVAICFVVIALR
jgi:hypothetical protein